MVTSLPQIFVVGLVAIIGMLLPGLSGRQAGGPQCDILMIRTLSKMAIAAQKAHTLVDAASGVNTAPRKPLRLQRRDRSIVEVSHNETNREGRGDDGERIGMCAQVDLDS